jgi:hypothetical protein
MKRLILFIGFIALTGVIFAQSWGASSVEYIQTYPQIQLVEHNDSEVIEMIRTSDTTDAQYQNYVKYITGDNFYSFFQNKKFYMLSCDTCKGYYREPSVEKPITRALYLFRLDNNGWTKACYEPIQIDYYRLISNTDQPIWSTYCYVPSKKGNSPNVKDGSVTVSPDGEVTIVLVNYNKYLESGQAIKQSYENKIVTLIQNDGELYTIKK